MSSDCWWSLQRPSKGPRSGWADQCPTGPQELGWVLGWVRGCPPGWRRACLVRWSLRVNRLVHKGQGKRFSPVCVR
jgi:hypothetical protein